MLVQNDLITGMDEGIVFPIERNRILAAISCAESEGFAGTKAALIELLRMLNAENQRKTAGV